MSKPVVVVTGASRGIGLAVTRHLLSSAFGAVVVAISRSRSPELFELGLSNPDLDVVTCDVTDEHKLTTELRHAAQKYHGIDALILNAGVLDPVGKVADTAIPLDQWKRHFDVNFFSLISAVRGALPALRKSSHGGRIVFVSSGAAAKGTAAWGPYNSSKAAMNSLCRTLAEEEPDVTSIALRPGMVDTDMQAEIRSMGATALAPADYDKFVQAYASGKLVKPEDCGHVIAALALRADKKLNGQFQLRIPIRTFWGPYKLLELDGDSSPPFVMPCIDVHHHFFPPDLHVSKARANQALGWRTPPGHLEWSPELSLKAMDELGIDISILSFPAISSGTVSEENRKVARERNKFVSQVCELYPARFGFFASLPFLDDIEGMFSCLAEIAYAFDVLRADGISLASSYGLGPSAKYIGHDLYDPVWRELDKRHAVVFLHGSQTPSSTPYPHPSLGVPITEVPNETYKAAAHLVVSGRKRLYPNAKIILAHMGGTLPSMAARTAALSNYMGCALAPEEILEDFKTFYFDTALSAYGPTLGVVEEWVGEGRVVFGSDFPAVSAETVKWFNEHLAEYASTTDARVGRGENKEDGKLQDILHRNVLALFPRW